GGHRIAPLLGHRASRNPARHSENLDTMIRSKFARAFVAGLSVAIVACGGGTGSGMSVPPPPPATSVKLASAQPYGSYLVDGSGRTLYLFAKDLPAGGGNAAVANCTGSAADMTSCVHYET